MIRVICFMMIILWAAILPLIGIISAIGIIFLKNWARILAISIAAVSLIATLFAGLYFLISFQKILFLFSLFLASFNVFILFYFTRPNIKMLFG